jgi:hypothetical protein
MALRAITMRVAVTLARLGKRRTGNAERDSAGEEKHLFHVIDPIFLNINNL